MTPDQQRQKQRTIGAIAKATGVKVTTIRYYESIGLMAKPNRTGSGQRVYDDQALDRLKFIKHARELGFPVETIRELIALQLQPEDSCDAVDKIVQRHLSDIRHRLRQLEALENELQRIADACQGGKLESCSVLNCLADHEQCISETHGKFDFRLS